MGEYAPTLRHVPERALRRCYLWWTTPDHIHDSDSVNVKIYARVFLPAIKKTVHRACRV